MLELDDPLWDKLDSAYGVMDVSAQIRRLSIEWLAEDADDLFYGALVHQGTCYAATYAAAPHLLALANEHAASDQRLEIALFLGKLVLSALGSSDAQDGALPGLPLDLKAWEATRNPARELLSLVSDRSRRDLAALHGDPRVAQAREWLAVAAPDAAELGKLHHIRDEFFALIPKIRDLCVLLFVERSYDESVAQHLLSGIAACEGLVRLAALLEGGREGGFACSNCGSSAEFLIFAEKMAWYRSSREDGCMLDFKDGRPSRQDGFVTPASGGESGDPRVDRLLRLAADATSDVPAQLLRNFLGWFRCADCGALSPVAGLDAREHR